MTLDDVASHFSSLYDLRGGEFSPLKTPHICTTDRHIAIVIPFKNRWEHLTRLLHNLHTVLTRQLAHYLIVVVEPVSRSSKHPLSYQTMTNLQYFSSKSNGTFNRGKLTNVAIDRIIKERGSAFNCLIVHDVDHLVTDDRMIYSCNASPQHLSVAATKFNYKLSRRFTGKVSLIPRPDFPTPHTLAAFSLSLSSSDGTFLFP